MEQSMMEDHKEEITFMAEEQTVDDPIVKGKRTKRLRPQSPPPPPPTNYSETTTAITNANKIIDSSSPESTIYNNNNTTNNSSPEKGGYMISTRTQEEDDQNMANCLILLAQGNPPINDHNKTHHHHLQMFSPTLMETQRYETPQKVNKVALGGYECKTCYKTFASFQALGGHRASCHKKPRKEYHHHESTCASMVLSDDHEFVPERIQFGNYYSNNNAGARSCKSRFMRRNHQNTITTNNNNNNNSSSNNSSFSSSSDSLSLQLVNTNIEPYNNTNAAAATITTKPPRVHECSHCGAVFGSGQALGGHMRRHRGAPVSTNASSKSINHQHNSHGRYQQNEPYDDQIVLSWTRTMTTTTEEKADNVVNEKDINLSLGLDLNLPAPGLTTGNNQDETKFRTASKQKDHQPQLDDPSNPLALSLMPPNFVDCQETHSNS